VSAHAICASISPTLRHPKTQHPKTRAAISPTALNLSAGYTDMPPPVQRYAATSDVPNAHLFSHPTTLPSCHVDRRDLDCPCQIESTKVGFLRTCSKADFPGVLAKCRPASTWDRGPRQGSICDRAHADCGRQLLLTPHLACFETDFKGFAPARLVNERPIVWREYECSARKTKGARGVLRAITSGHTGLRSK
jgi:hypothetical protein